MSLKQYKNKADILTKPVSKTVLGALSNLVNLATFFNTGLLQSRWLFENLLTDFGKIDFIHSIKSSLE